MPCSWRPHGPFAPSTLGVLVAPAPETSALRRSVWEVRVCMPHCTVSEASGALAKCGRSRPSSARFEPTRVCRARRGAALGAAPASAAARAPATPGRLGRERRSDQFARSLSLQPTEAAVAECTGAPQATGRRRPWSRRRPWGRRRHSVATIFDRGTQWSRGRPWRRGRHRVASGHRAAAGHRVAAGACGRRRPWGRHRPRVGGG